MVATGLLDIRDQLRIRRDEALERLNRLQAQRDRLEQEIAVVRRELQAAESLLQIEEERFRTGHQFSFTGEPDARLAEGVLRVLERGRKLPAAEIADILLASGHGFGGKKPGRAVHFALLGLRQRGLVRAERAPNGATLWSKVG
jgi:hypothetical protein